jgi:hypothetical protein
MRLGDALDVLGVDAATPWAEVRRAYRERIRRWHPDVAGPHAGPSAALLNEAFRLVRAAVERGDHPTVAPVRTVTEPEPPPGRPGGVALVDDDGLALVAPPDEVFDRIHMALHSVGHVTYVDPEAGLLECLLELEGRSPSQLTVSLQGRGETTEAFFTLESIDASVAPPLPDVVRLLAERLRRMPG